MEAPIRGGISPGPGDSPAVVALCLCHGFTPNGGFSATAGHDIVASRRRVTRMNQAVCVSTISIGALEAGYPMYCQAMRLLIRDGTSLEQIQRSLCWDRLRSLHHCLPRSYRKPEQLYVHLKREICA